MKTSELWCRGRVGSGADHRYLWIVGVAISALILCACDPGKGSKNISGASGVNLQPFVDRWLQTDCDVGEEGKIVDSALAWRDELIPLLLDAAVYGPSDSLSAHFLQGAQNMYSRIVERYGAGDSLLLGETDREAFAKQTLASFSERRFNDWAAAYRARALIALSELKYEKGKDLFEDVLADPTLSDLHKAAKQGLGNY